MSQSDKRGQSIEDEDEDEEFNNDIETKSLNFINEVPSVLCLYLVIINLMFLILCISILILQFNSLRL